MRISQFRPIEGQPKSESSQREGRASQSAELDATFGVDSTQAAAEARAARRALFGHLAGAGRKPGEVAATNIFELAGLWPKRGEPIALIGRSHYLGDSLVGVLGRIHALHQLFPDSPIKVVHSFANVLRPSDWLKPVQVEKLAQDSEFKRHIRSDDFLVSIDGSTEPIGLIRSLGNPAVVSRLQLSEFTSFGSVWSGGPRKRMDSTDLAGWHGRPFPKLAGDDRFAERSHYQSCNAGTLPIRLTHETLYELKDLETRILLGDSNGSALPIEYFVDLKATENATGAFLKRAFGTDDADYLAMNFNTASSWKVDDLKRDFVARLTKWVECALQTPRRCVLLTAPEQQFGEAISAGVRALVERFPGRVAVFPDDKALWLPLIQQATGVVTQDSGFTHMSLVVQPKENVLTTGRTGEVARWRKPGQRFFQGTSDEPIFEWIKSRPAR